jgi:transcription initiation factor TFIIB
MQNIEDINRCPSCGSLHLSKDYNRAELVCDDCGLVIDEDFIDPGPEWRSFDEPQHLKRNRVGLPPTYTIHDKGLSTTIGYDNKDSYGKSIPSRNRAQVFRLRKWQNRVKIYNGSERNLAIALSTLDRMASSLGLPRNVRETAALTYRKASKSKLVKGRSIEGVAAASLYAACRQCNVPRTLDEISAISNVLKREIGRNYRRIAKGIGLKSIPTNPEDYISRFCSELKLSSDVKSMANDILKEAAKKRIISGKCPTGLAASSLYIASVLCSEHRTQYEVARVAGVTEVTIRNRYKELIKKLDISVS